MSCYKYIPITDESYQLQQSQAHRMKHLIILVFLSAFIASSLCEHQDGHQNKNEARQRTPEEQQHFRAWRNKFYKKYVNPADEEAALHRVLRTKDEIDEHNKRHDEGKETYRRRLWEHSDLTKEEKRKYLLGVAVPPKTRSLPAIITDIPNYPPGPKSLDWRDKGLVGPVQSQGTLH